MIDAVVYKCHYIIYIESYYFNSKTENQIDYEEN